MTATTGSSAAGAEFTTQRSSGPLPRRAEAAVAAEFQGRARPAAPLRRSPSAHRRLRAGRRPKWPWISRRCAEMTAAAPFLPRSRSARR